MNVISENDRICHQKNYKDCKKNYIWLQIKKEFVGKKYMDEKENTNKKILIYNWKHKK